MLLRQIEETEKAISFPEEEIEKQAGELRAKEMKMEEDRASKYNILLY